jgi:predicted phage tail component-like protein
MKTFPNIPVPQKRYNEVEVSGKDGKYLEENGYEDIVITLELNFIIKDAKWHDRVRQIKNWLLESMNRELIFEDDAAFFYKVKKVELGEIEHTTRRIGNLTANLTCEPYTYLRNGKVKMKSEEAEQNPYLLCKPVYYVQGEGLCVINVNGKDMEVNVSGNLIIDTERMLAYREDGTLGNTKITGEYEELYLKPGRNRISVSPGFVMRVKPNWRCL